MQEVDYVCSCGARESSEGRRRGLVKVDKYYHCMWRNRELLFRMKIDRMGAFAGIEKRPM